MLGAWLLAAAGGLLAGLLTAGAVERDLDRQRSERQEIPAVVTADAVDAAPVRQIGARPARATVRWTGPDGSAHTDGARVPPGTRAGTGIAVWIDQRGRLAQEPLSGADAGLRAATAGVLVATAAGGTAWGCGWLVRVCLDRQRLRQWDEEWDRIDTQWGRKTG
ncbi:Rv1733c family protein [Streptomyces sp. NPDC002547]